MLVMLRCLLLNELIVAVSAVISLMLPRVVRVLIVRIGNVGAFLVVLGLIIMISLLLVLLHDSLMVLTCFIQLGRVKLLQTFFFLKVLVEAGKFGTKSKNVLHFTHQNAIELANVVFNVALGLFNMLQDAHVLLNDVNDFIDVLPMLRNQ